MNRQFIDPVQYNDIQIDRAFEGKVLKKNFQPDALMPPEKRKQKQLVLFTRRAVKSIHEVYDEDILPPTIEDFTAQLIDLGIIKTVTASAEESRKLAKEWAKRAGITLADQDSDS